MAWIGSAAGIRAARLHRTARGINNRIKVLKRMAYCFRWPRPSAPDGAPRYVRSGCIIARSARRRGDSHQQRRNSRGWGQRASHHVVLDRGISERATRDRGAVRCKRTHDRSRFDSRVRTAGAKLTTEHCDGGMPMQLRILLEPSEDGGYTVSVPSLPGCISEGETREDALANIREAIELYLEPVDE